MLKNYHSYLRDIGLSEIQIQLYDYIIEEKSGTILEFKEKLNLSYAQVNYNLSILEDMGLIFSSKSEKNKKYFRIDPQIALTKLLDERIKGFKEQISLIGETIKAEESTSGKCYANITFYHYTDINLAAEYHYKLIENCRNEIYMSALPPTLLKKLEPAFYNSFLRGIHLVLYFSNEDFDSINNYFDQITDILKRIRIEIIQVKERTCQQVRYNDLIVNNGVFLIDEKYLNTVLFLNDDIFHFDGFFGSNFVQQSKRYLEVKTIIKRIKIEYPEPFQTVLNIIQDKENISTKELSIESKIGGGKLREILNYFINQGIVKEIEIKGDSGKPRKEYILIEKKKS
ncbi:MAG: helix-turn-helix domain-containing protein [Candidatus Heimdallarchaeota archaeon]